MGLHTHDCFQMVATIPDTRLIAPGLFHGEYLRRETSEWVTTQKAAPHTLANISNDIVCIFLLSFHEHVKCPMELFLLQFRPFSASDYFSVAVSVIFSLKHANTYYPNISYITNFQVHFFSSLSVIFLCSFFLLCSFGHFLFQQFEHILFKITLMLPSQKIKNVFFFLYFHFREDRV